MPLVLGNLTSGQTAMLLGDDLTEAEIVSAQMRGSWTRSPPTGSPAGRRSTSCRKTPTRVFDLEPAVVPYPEEVSRRIWQGYVFAALPLLTGI